MISILIFICLIQLLCCLYHCTHALHACMLSRLLLGCLLVSRRPPRCACGRTPLSHSRRLDKSCLMVKRLRTSCVPYKLHANSIAASPSLKCQRQTCKPRAATSKHWSYHDNSQLKWKSYMTDLALIGCPSSRHRLLLTSLIMRRGYLSWYDLWVCLQRDAG
jgi:hypothetical protein